MLDQHRRKTPDISVRSKYGHMGGLEWGRKRKVVAEVSRGPGERQDWRLGLGPRGPHRTHGAAL